jgi:hypothetical protein
MKKLTHIAAALANNTLSKRSMSEVKGGTDTTNVVTTATPLITSATDDEKRRERPGGGISTN